MKKLRPILFCARLFTSLLIFGFRGKTLKISLAASILSNFAKVIKSNVNFLTTPAQQRKIIPEFARMSRLINDALKSGNVSQEELAAIIQDNNQETGSDVRKIADSFFSLKNIVPRASRFNEFCENAKKSWEANNSRNIKSNTNPKMSPADVLRATKESGGLFFVALVYLLCPKTFDSNFKKAIYSSGAWFQFLDDYRDRKEDIGFANTVFTVPQSNSHKEMLKKHIAESKTEIQKILGEQNALIKFMEDLTSSVLLFDFTKRIFDWK